MPQIPADARQLVFAWQTLLAALGNMPPRQAITHAHHLADLLKDFAHATQTKAANEATK